MAGWVGTARKKKKENKLLTKCFNGFKLFKKYLDFKKRVILILNSKMII